MSDNATRTPSETPSDEADQKQLDMAQKEGHAYYQALQYMVSEVADTGAEQRAGDYIVAFAQERAEGMYHLQNGKLEWIEPTDENCHFEIAVLDASDRRFIPQLAVQLTVIDSEGNEVGTEEMPFLWHPGLYHYGLNWTVPSDGTYTLKVHIDPPTFMRHDKTNGERYARAVDVTFENVQVTTGQD